MRLLRFSVPALLCSIFLTPSLGATAGAGMAGFALQAGQNVSVSGRVTDAESGQPLAGVVVRVSGTDQSTATDADGTYSLVVPSDAVLVFASIGHRAVYTNVAGRTTIDISLTRVIAELEEVIVTGYTTQRRADITGAVSSVNMESATKQTSASVLQKLDGRVSGVTVDASGSPGSRNTVRVRGATSFQNNDPLYIVDGQPLQGESYLNWLNPNDIQSMQVLKDASAASIYGARAGNGVIIIETKKGRSGPARVSLDVRMGMASPTRGYDDFLITDALQYHEFLQRSYVNAGLPVPENIYGDPGSPSIPAYTWPNDGVSQTTNVDESTYSYPNSLIMPGSVGTNWWDAVFSPGRIADANMRLSGGGTDHTYSVSFNYFDQEGTAAFNRFQRGTIRANTQFTVGKVTVGENVSLALEENYGGAGDPGGFAEGGILGKNILMQPVVPIYDIAGNFAAGKAVGLGNQSNPLKEAWANKDDVFKGTRIVGNAFANLALTDKVSLKTNFGFNLGESQQTFYDPIDPELSEPSFSNGINENYNRFTEWSWSNTLNYLGSFDRHTFSVLLGQEAFESTSRGINGSINNLLTTDIDSRYLQDAIGDPSTKNVASGGAIGSLVSFFGKVDYNYAERYHLSVTVRRDGSSRFGPDNRWATFPAFGVGWRLSEESFMSGQGLFSNIMLRFGYGVTGNENIPSGRVVSQYGGGRGDTFYAIAGGNTISAGYRQTSLGNSALKWEENESVNVGFDLGLFGGKGSLVVDLYERNTDNLLFDPPVPATAGIAAPPIVNIGQMRNRGIDFSLGYNGTIGDRTAWNMTFNGSHYKNEIVRIDGVQDFFFGPVTTRYGNQVINQVGHPIGSFYGLINDGIFENQAAVDAHADQNGKEVGRLRFRDLNGDGAVNSEDRTIIGSPHPDFTAGLDLGVQYGAWDFSATLFGTFGNDIFEVQKEFYVFYNFSTNVRSDLLTESANVENGQVTNPGAKYPQIDRSDTFSGQQLSDFYIEDGSYVRLRNLQVGYTLPQTWIQGVRVFVQGENLFTITGYPGLDPTLPAAAVFGPAGDIRDQYRGVDRGAYPSNKVFTLGVSATF